MQMAELYQRQWLLVRLPVLVVAAIAAAFLWLGVYPLPPTQLSITTADVDGAYHLHAQRYAERFAEHGITLTVQVSKGSQHNLERLRQPDNPTDLAFVQGGFGYLGTALDKRERSPVVTLANVDIEPLWLFTRQREISSLPQLQGLRLAIGPEGSGSRKVALKLLEQARMDAKDLTLSSLTGSQAVQALQQGKLDAMLMVAPPDSLTVQSLLGLPDIQLANLKRTAAITERNAYLESRLLTRGTLGPRLPPGDITLLTTSTSLVARDGLHPALKRLATSLATELHAGGGLFHRSGEFPSLRRIDFPTSPEARQTLAHGLPALERALPFWWAQIAQRLLLIVLPTFLLALGLTQLILAYLRWALESQFNRWYGELKYIENDLGREKLSGMDLSRFLVRLNGIDQAMLAFATPADLMARGYTLHHHIEFVRQRLYRMRGR